MLVTVHAATALCGAIAQVGATTSLSTPEGRRSAHRARAEADAILVGSDTVRIDDPQLTIRPEFLDEVAATEDSGASPVRVVLASRLRVSPRSRLFDKPGRVLVMGVEGDARALEEVGAEVVLVPAGPDGMVGLRDALDALRERGVERLLVEGGSRILTSFFRERLVDRVELEITMTILGSGTPLVGALGFAPALRDVRVERLGTSVLLRGEVAR